MSVVKKNSRITQKIGVDQFLLLHPETSAENVLVNVEGIAASDAKSALAEIKSNLVAIESEYAQKSELPTKISQLENDLEFITRAVSDLENYYLKSSLYTKEEVDQRISMIPKFAIEIVDALPINDISTTTIYFVRTGDDSDNVFTEYVYVDEEWEKLGTQKLDLTNYATKVFVSEAIATLDAQLAAVAKSGSYNDLTDTPEKLSDFEDDTLTNPVAAAQKLSTAKTISISGGVTGDATSFDGSENISINVTAVNGSVINGTASIDVTGNAGTATKLESERNIALTGDATASGNFDGSKNIELEVVLKNSGITAGTYSAVVFNEKGIATSGGQLVEVGTTGQTAPSANLAIGGLFFEEI